MRFLRLRALVLAAVLCLSAANLLIAADEPNLTKERIREFLLTAQVVKSKQTSKGVTSPWRLTLSDGKLTHDAAFQAVDETKTMMQFASGAAEIHFVDSYRYDLAAYELAELLGLDDMMPVTVERTWNGQKGALSWWLPWKWDEGMRIKQKLVPPDPESWNRQMHKMWVFAQLVYDTDRNMGNILIREDWKIWMIDFTRAFRLHSDLQDTKVLVQCDRQLHQKMMQLDAKVVAQKTKKHLTPWEIKALMARRDKILAHFQKLIAQKGEAAVLY